MARTLTASEAKKFAFSLLSGVQHGDWTGQGLTVTKDAAEAIRQIGLSQIAEPVPDSRQSPSGNAYDLYAPSPWHALAALLLQEGLSRIKRGSLAEGLKNSDQTFGGRPFYRGQPRAWDIQPTAWRSADAARSSAEWVQAFARALCEHLSRNPDPVMDCVQRDLDDNDRFAGLAQHYELPTNLVDFSLNPLVAMAFACGNAQTPSVQPRDSTDPRLSGCAVVYVIAAPAFATAAAAAFEFPPSYSTRLYRQKGLFANFGLYPGELEKQFPEDYSASWCWLQQNSQRVFFPRKYPVLEGADEMRDHELMEGDEFLIEIVRRVRAGAPCGPSAIFAIPPWVISADPEQLGLAHAHFCRSIDSYLRSACLIKMEKNGDIFDPVMLKLLESWLGSEVEYLLEMAKHAKHPGLDWTAERIQQSRAMMS